MHRDAEVSAEDHPRLPHLPATAADYALSVFATAPPDWATALRARLRVWPDGRWRLDFDDGTPIEGACATPGCPMGRLLAALSAA